YRCLEKDRERRFQSTAELAAELAPYAGSPAQAAITLERTRGLHGSARHSARRWRRSWIAAAGLLAGAGAAFAAIEHSTAAGSEDRAARFAPAPAPATSARPEPVAPAPVRFAPATDANTAVPIAMPVRDMAAEVHGKP